MDASEKACTGVRVMSRIHTSCRAYTRHVMHLNEHTIESHGVYALGCGGFRRVAPRALSCRRCVADIDMTYGGGGGVGECV